MGDSRTGADTPNSDQVSSSEDPVDVVLQWQHTGEEGIGLSFAGYVISNTTQYGRGAQHGLA